MAGKRTSIWLPDEVIADWHASGLSLAELVKIGLANQGPSLEGRVARVERDLHRLQQESALRSGYLAGVAVQGSCHPSLRGVYKAIADLGVPPEELAALMGEHDDESREAAQPPRLFGPLANDRQGT